ncbi:DNA recombination and repair protein RecO [Pediococcus damnosus]|uniref:DNA repair protein RecO n=1 Tax=Pediococcus damnosus TaxID=51663 RepID=UPI00078E5D20|nr:DNA repair protein RecO [Pediococcus damnosus]AMV61581.1 DNA recombination and repair protein RecO [Pediococcus damnosus]AMV65943.1 DNA recombination and repair protein RecO [Pediococcus damnosus]
MATQTTAQFDGIIMFRRNYRERDQLVKIFTRQFGKKMFYIRGARKRGFKLATAILPFTKGVYVGLIREKGLCYLNAEKSLTQFDKINEDIGRNAYITYILNLIDSAFDDGLAIPIWFDMASAALSKINAGFDPQIIAHIFELQLLPTFGVQQEWQQCIVCHRDDLPLDYSESSGGVLCQNHWHLDPKRSHLDRRTIYYLQQLSSVRLQNVQSIHVHAETKAKLKAIIDMIYEDEVGLKLKSKHFIDTMPTWN